MRFTGFIVDELWNGYHGCVVLLVSLFFFLLSSLSFAGLFIERSLGRQGSEVNGIRFCWRGAE